MDRAGRAVGKAVLGNGGGAHVDRPGMGLIFGRKLCTVFISQGHCTRTATGSRSNRNRATSNGSSRRRADRLMDCSSRLTFQSGIQSRAEELTATGGRISGKFWLGESEDGERCCTIGRASSKWLRFNAMRSSARTAWLSRVTFDR